MRGYIAAACAVGIVGLCWLLLHSNNSSLAKETKPCEAAGGVLVLSASKEWVCVQPIRRVT
jgi:hypothetical protein